MTHDATELEIIAELRRNMIHAEDAARDAFWSGDTELQHYHDSVARQCMADLARYV